MKSLRIQNLLKDAAEILVDMRRRIPDAMNGNPYLLIADLDQTMSVLRKIRKALLDAHAADLPGFEESKDL